MSSLKNSEKPDRNAWRRRSKREEDETGLTGNLSETTPVDRIRGTAEHAFLDDEGIGEVFGSETGEGDRDITAGGWAGTDDATSTAPSDLSEGPEDAEKDPEASLGRAYAGGIAEDDGGVADLTGTPVEESRNWNADPIRSRE